MAKYNFIKTWRKNYYNNKTSLFNEFKAKFNRYGFIPKKISNYI